MQGTFAKKKNCVLVIGNLKSFLEKEDAGKITYHIKKRDERKLCVWQLLYLFYLFFSPPIIC